MILKRYTYLSTRTFFPPYSYNRGAHSVEYEFLSNKYQERYVGSETSCTVIDKTSSLQDSLTASAKKKARKHPWNYSPGRRLSHLARRRQIFTSASLPRARAVTGNRTKANVMDSRRMILLDNRWVIQGKLNTVYSFNFHGNSHENYILKRNVV